MHINAYWIIAWKKTSSKFVRLRQVSTVYFSFYKSLSDGNMRAESNNNNGDDDDDDEKRYRFWSLQFILTFLNNLIDWKFQFYSQQCVRSQQQWWRKKCLFVCVHFFSYLFKQKTKSCDETPFFRSLVNT